MATRFGSAVQRSFWFGLLFAVAADFAIALIIAWAFGNEGGQILLVAVLIVGAMYAFQLVCALIGLIRSVAIFFLFDKENRISTVVDRMVSANLPPPQDFYTDPVDYLFEVAHSKDASDDAKLFAGATLGGIEALRSISRGFLAMSTHIVLEAAIRRYSKRFAPSAYSR